MPTSLSAVYCCMPCRTASIAFATTASSPMAGAATTSPSAAGCSRQPIPSRRPVAPKAIDEATSVTSLSAPSAAAPCGGSQPCRAPPLSSHSTVIRHDLIAPWYRRHRQRACCATCRHQYSYADRLQQSRLQHQQTHQTDVLLAQSTCSANSS